MSNTDRIWKVYSHTNKVNNKRYIGITSLKPEKRWGYQGNGYKDCPKFWNAIVKYSWDGFIHEILYSNLTRDEAAQMEIELIIQFDTIKNGYNQEPGGIGGSRSEETKNKIRKARKKQIMTQETINKIAAAHRGMKYSEEAVKHIKESRIPFYKAVECIETGEKFVSITSASDIKHVPISGITRSCKRYEKNLPTRNKGFHWRYTN